MSHPVPPERSKRDDRCKETNMQQIFRVKGLSVTYTLSCVAMGNSFSPELEEPKERSSRPDVSESVQEPCATPSEVVFRPTGWPRCWQPTSAADPCSSASRRWTNQRNKNVKQLVDWYLVRPPEFVTFHDVGEKYREVVGEDHIAAVAKQAWIAGEHSVRYSCYDLHLRWVPIQNFLNQVDVVDWALVTKAEAMYLLAMRGWPYSVSDIYLNAFGPVSPIQLRELPN